MKKKLLTIFGVLCAAALCTAAFTACDDGGSTETPEDPVTYTVTTDEGIFADYYTMNTSVRSASAGDTVTVTLSDMWDFLSISEVYANSTACTQGSDENSFSFTMPAENVTITAEFAVNDIEEDDGMAWTDNSGEQLSANSATLTSGSSLNQCLYVTFGSKPITNRGTTNADGYLTLTDIDVISTNQDVIPNTAVTRITNGDSTAYNYEATVYFDGNAISPGETIIILIDNYNDRAITINVTVEERNY